MSKQDGVSCLAVSDSKALAHSEDAAALAPSGPLKLPVEGAVWQDADPSLDCPHPQRTFGSQHVSLRFYVRDAYGEGFTTDPDSGLSCSRAPA